MKEYGGYIELDTYRLPMLHDGAIALNCGRNCLAYLIKSRQIKRIKMPYFMCDSVLNVCKKYGVEMSFYHIDSSFKPENITLGNDEWLYVMNYYGQLTKEYLEELKQKHDRVIVDNAQAYFDMPIPNTDTIYTCRKYFGVADGAFLYTNSKLDEEFAVDESYDRMRFLLGRFERTASEFYNESQANNRLFADEPIKKMSKLTDNLLHGIDYEFVKHRRTENFKLYHKKLKSINELELREVEGAFAYPLMVKNGAEVRRKLQQKKIYVPTLWPNVLNEVSKDGREYRCAEDILPLPCDQRFKIEDIKSVINMIIELLGM
ncbi:MAG: hypothetical protein IJ746_07135 [Ruminococcus sp.]|nr:hypothetical protein [Ruminococcus sp.]